jgi:fatty acid-binding protein DegV
LKLGILIKGKHYKNNENLSRQKESSEERKSKKKTSSQSLSSSPASAKSFFKSNSKTIKGI